MKHVFGRLFYRPRHTRHGRQSNRSMAARLTLLALFVFTAGLTTGSAVTAALLVANPGRWLW